MPINIQDYLLGRIPVGRKIDIPAYLMAKAASGGIQEITGTLPLYVRSRASQVLKNYIIYGTAEGAGVETENLFDVTKITENSIADDEDGRVYARSAYNTSPLIAVSDADSVYFNFSKVDADSRAMLRIAFYDENDNYLSFRHDTNVQSPKKFDLLTGAKKIRFSYTNGNGDGGPIAQTAIQSIVVTDFDILIDHYIPYGYKLPLTVRTENLFDKDAKDTENGYISDAYLNSDGAIVEHSNYIISEYIPVTPGNSYYLTFFTNSVPINPALTYYNENKGYVGGRKYEAQKNININLGSTSSVRYVRLSIAIAGTYQVDNATTLTLGSTPPDHYIPYYNTETPIYIGDSQLMAEEYVDYKERKIYKLVDGTLTPTDPPVPLPDITLPQAEVTIDTEEEFKSHASVKGRINPVHYAYSINADTAEITYLADNKDFTPAAMGSTTFDYGSWGNAFFIPRPCMLKSNGKVDYYLDPNDYSKKLDGTASDIADPTYDGNVMLEFPKIWYKFVPEGTDGEGGTFHCSNAKIDDSYECWCNYDANNNEIDHFYVAAYNAVILDDKMRSLSGYALTQENGADTTTGATEISAARANNQNGIDEWYTYLISDHQLLTYLATLMCKHVNHQTKFGRGIDSGSTTAKRAYVTGTLNDKGLFWGDTSTGTQAVKIFGIENFYACVWKRTAGLLGTSTGYVYKLTHGTKDGSTAASFNTNGSGYKTLARTKPANGWVTTMHHESNGFWIPATTGTNRFNVYYYNGNGYVLVGGYSSAGSTCGSWYVGLHDGVSDSSWGISSALSCKPKA